ncbi:hypothetical protein [Qipengyuania oceanensis]|uniref:Helix-hairpin-helix domain-containing protein n=1 Tax=Qipengyuania oceanensis TaxID=1463597 RepID=A0A844YBU0_9SPHN|nr:hypothetical protein [Qipengyuania oceanensis]MXO61457.1 hypothetical protein [Qipengyuania oceanensis]
MRKILIAATISTSALTLAACSGGADEAATEETAAAEVEAPAAEATADAAVLDASTATAEQLAAIEGMTPELAAAVVAGQPYASATAFNAKLMETLDEAQAATVREKVFVPVDLNTATREDIELIPGMTPKMVHEFEEYRPYADMTEFDREIGKYVDEAEVARFRQYVTL